MLKDARPLRRLAAVAKIGLAVFFLMMLGFIVGLMVVVMPPLAWLGVLALSIAFLLWVMPDMPLVSQRLITQLFYIAFASQIIFPAYYAFAIPGLPWISLRRLAWFPMVLALSLRIASSSEARAAIVNALGGAKSISIPAIGFIVAQFLSIFTSINFSESLKDFANSFLYWYIALFASILCLSEEKPKRVIFWTICYVCILAGLAGSYESVIQTHFVARLWPESILAQLFADDPDVFDRIVRNIVRGGQFRANFIYNVSLSYGEFLAVCAPICLYFALHGENPRERTTGIVASVCSLAGVYASGSRGAMTAAAVAVPLTIFLWILRMSKRSPNTMATPVAAVGLFWTVLGFATLMLASNRFKVAFTGGAEAAGSTEARFDQFRLALPKILANPVTGHGTGLGADIVGYRPFGGLTVDSYVISLLAETGLFGLITFFAMILLAVYLLVRDYLKDADRTSVYSGGIACALASFAIYRLALSQRENHILLFVLVGMAIAQCARSRNADRPAADRFLAGPAPP